MSKTRRHVRRRREGATVFSPISGMCSPLPFCRLWHAVSSPPSQAGSPHASRRYRNIRTVARPLAHNKRRRHTISTPQDEARHRRFQTCASNFSAPPGSFTPAGRSGVDGRASRLAQESRQHAGRHAERVVADRRRDHIEH